MSLLFTPVEIKCTDVNDTLHLAITGYTTDHKPIVIDAVGAYCSFTIEVPKYTKPLPIYDHHEQFQEELFDHITEWPMYNISRYAYKMYTYKQEDACRVICCYFKSLESMTRCREQLSKRLRLTNFGTFKLKIYGGELPYTDYYLKSLIGIKRRYPLIDKNTIDISCLYPDLNNGRLTKRALK